MNILPKLKEQIKPSKITESFQCSDCKETQKSQNFYKTKNHTSIYFHICKKCLNSNTDFNDESNLFKILREMNIPFIRNVWENEKKNYPDCVFGTYLKRMRLPQYNKLEWRDDYLIIEDKAEERALEDIEEKKHGKKPNFNKKIQKVTIEMFDLFGDGYNNAEYVAMWNKYNSLKENYPTITNLHVEALVTYVRYKVKEEFATASDNSDDAKKWGEMANKAATNAKINPSQLSKSDLTGGLNSFSELTKAVEQAVDIIPILPQFKQRPNDVLDFIIWCFINYVRDAQGLSPAEYPDVYAFYDRKKQEYIKEYGDPLGMFAEDRSELLREKIQNFINIPKEDNEEEDD